MLRKNDVGKWMILENLPLKHDKNPPNEGPLLYCNSLASLEHGWDEADSDKTDSHELGLPETGLDKMSY